MHAHEKKKTKTKKNTTHACQYRKAPKKIREALSCLSWANPCQENPTRIIAEFINMQKRAKESDAQTDWDSATSRVTRKTGAGGSYNNTSK